MNEKIKQLQNLGCDIDEIMTRFLGDEDFYFECYEQAIQDEKFVSLGEALREDDLRRAFEDAHTLKGLTANLGLESLGNLVIEILEPLRQGKNEGLLKKYELLLKEREKYLQILLNN